MHEKTYMFTNTTILFTQTLKIRSKKTLITIYSSNLTPSNFHNELHKMYNKLHYN
jgi:hypothetical protein